MDLVNTLQELSALGVGFVSLCEALDLTTPSGRALAGMLAVFAEFERDILRDRVKAEIEQARKDGKPHGRPMTAGKLAGGNEAASQGWAEQAGNRQAPRHQSHLSYPLARPSEVLLAP